MIKGTERQVVAEAPERKSAETGAECAVGLGLSSTTVERVVRKSTPVASGLRRMWRKASSYPEEHPGRCVWCACAT